MSASDDLVFLGTRFKAILDLVPLLQQKESLESLEQEVQNRVNGLKSIEEGIHLSIDEKAKELKTIEEKAKNLLSDIKSHEAKLSSLQKHIADLKSKF